MFKRFRMPTGTATIASVLGHSAVLGKEFVGIHESLWRLAYAEGAIAEDNMEVTRNYVQEKRAEMDVLEANEREEIKALMKDKILQSPTDYLDSNNLLIYRKAVALTKKTYKKEYFDTLWKEITDEVK